MRLPSAAPTKAQRGWTARTSRTSRRMASSGGLANWRLRSREESYQPDPIRDRRIVDDSHARFEQIF